MAHEGIYATAAQVTQKAGAGASATASAEAFINSFLLQAENYINVMCRVVFATNTTEFNALNAGVSSLLTEAASNLAAIYIAQYDLSGYASAREAENIINMNWARFTQCIKLLNEQKAAGFISDPTA